MSHGDGRTISRDQSRNGVERSSGGIGMSRLAEASILIRRLAGPTAPLPEPCWNGTLENKIWIACIQALACRRWLSCDPPELEQATLALDEAAEVFLDIGVEVDSVVSGRPTAGTASARCRSLDELEFRYGALQRLISTVRRLRAI